MPHKEIVLGLLPQLLPFPVALSSLMMAPFEEAMESVPLAPPENETTNVTQIAPTEPAVEEQQQEAAPTVDPWALPEGEPGETPPEGEEEEGGEDLPPTDTMRAVASLKESSARLGSAFGSSASGVDQKLGLTRTLGALDEKTHVSQSVKYVGGALGEWWSSIDSKLGVTETAKELSTDFNKNIVKPLQATTVVQESTRNLQTFDETHGITRSAASTLAKGADMLANSLVGGGSNNDPDDDGPNPVG
jgi:hypothetical protein